MGPSFRWDDTEYGACLQARIAASISPALVEVVTLDDTHEDALALAALGIRAGAGLAREISRARRRPVSISELYLGLECGHSDASSGLAANPLAHAVSQQWGGVLRAFAISSLGSITYYVGITYVPAFLASAGSIAEAAALWLSTIAAVAVILVTPLVGLLSDRLGRKPALLGLAALSAELPISMFSLMAGASTARALTGAVVLALVAGGVSAVGAIATGEQFSERSRASGLGLGYTVATAVFGGLTPYVAQRLVETTGSPLMPGIMIAVVAVAALPVFALMRETAPLRR